MAQNISTAVMQRRVEASDSFDYFPTPGWGTRTLCEHLDPECLAVLDVHEPACGGGHMSRVLAEYFAEVRSSDVFDYGAGEVADFLFSTDVYDWIITNPPFRLAAEFVEHALKLSNVGCAMLCRSAFLEGGKRYNELFKHTPPNEVLIFSGRLPIVKGRVDSEASSATSYAWFIWEHDAPEGPFIRWVPPEARKKYERAGDYDTNPERTET